DCEQHRADPTNHIHPHFSSERRRAVLKTICRVVVCAALLAVLCLLRPAAARADEPNMQDYNTWWQVAEDPTPPSTTLDSNTYWAEVQAKQEWPSRASAQ